MTVFLTGFLILEFQVGIFYFLKENLPIFQQWIDGLILESQYMQFLSYGPKILLAVIIPVFDDLYHKVAVWLNDMGEAQ